MKKLLILAVAMLLSLNIMAGEMVLKVGYDVNKDTKEKYTTNTITTESNENSDMTLHVQLEGYGNFSDNVYGGFGIEIPTVLVVDGDDLAKVVPVYFAVKVKGDNGEIKPYIGAKIGAAVPFYEGDTSGLDEKAGLFWGLNAGMEFSSNILVEMFYEESNYSIENSYNNQKLEFTTPKIGINVGYNFNL